MDVPVTTLSGSFTIDGAVLDSKEGRTQVSLGTAAGDWVTLASNTGAYQALVVPGTYDLYYSPGNPDKVGTHVPGNDMARLKSGVVIGTTPLSLNIDIPTVTLSGIVTVNGAVLMDPGSNGGLVTLTNSLNGSVGIATTAPASGDGRYSTVIIAGAYDAFLRVYGGSAGLPRNSHMPLGCLTAQ